MIIFAKNNLMITKKVIIDSTICSTRELIDLYSHELSFPYESASLNWDAFRDAIVELDDWLEVQKVVIEHKSLPILPERDMEIYINLMYEAERTWKKTGMIEFSVNYPAKFHSYVNNILGKNALDLLDGYIESICAGYDRERNIKKYYVLTASSCVHVFSDNGCKLLYDYFSVYELKDIEKTKQPPIMKAESGIAEILPLVIQDIGDGEIEKVTKNYNSLELCFINKSKIMFSVTDGNIMMQITSRL